MQIRSASNTNEVNWDDPLNKGLVSWYSFNQKGGNVLRDVVGNYDGTLTGMDPSTDWVPSPENKSRALDINSTEYVNLGNNKGIAGVPQFTVAFWFKPSSASMTNNGVLSYRSSVAAGSGPITIRTVGGGLLRAYVANDSGQEKALSTATAITDTDRWYHLTVTWTSSDYQYWYVDGAEEASTSTWGGVTEDTARDLWLGAYYTTAYSAVGQYSDLRMYDRALSGQEVSDLYQASRTGYVDQYKRRSFPVGVTPTPTESHPSNGLIRLRQNAQPSYKAGYAKSAAESAYPELWQDLAGAWIPQMGQSGDMLLDLSGHGNNGTFVSSPSWRMKDGRQSLFFDGVDDRVDIANVEFGTEFTAIIAKEFSGSSSPSKYMLAGQNGGSNQWLLWQYGGYTSWNHSGSEIRSVLKTGYRVVAGTHQPTNLNELYQSAANSPGGIDRTASGTFEYTGTNKGSLIIGGRTSDNNRNWEGDLYAVLFYNRALAFNELQTIRADPLAPFRQRRYAPVSLPTAAPTFNHWYAVPGRINRIVGSGVNF